VEKLALEFGFSSYVTRGVSTLVSDEFLAAALKKVSHGPFRIISVVDHDVGGRLITRTLATHLRSYGLTVEEPEQLMGPHLFTPEEIARLALPCTARNLSQATKVKNWVQEGGGINGQPLMLHVNHLRPYERLRAALLAHLQKVNPNA